jgi:protein-glutamine gamma-glutamyltransferase
MTRTHGLRRSVLLLLVTSSLPVLLVAESIELLALLLLAVIASWLLVDPNDKPLIGSRTLTVGAFAAIFYCSCEWLFRDVPAVVALGRFFVFTSVCKCLDRKTNRDCGQLFVLSALLMICGAILSGELIYPVCVVIYLIVGTHGLILFHLKRESDAVDAQRRVQSPAFAAVRHSDARLPVGAVRTISLVSSAGTLVVAVAVFFLSPRAADTGVLGSLKGTGGQAVTGFSTEVSFSDTGIIQKNAREVMRVKLTLEGENFGQAGFQPYFRGVVFDRYFRPDPDGQITQWLRVSRRTVQARQMEIGPVPRNLIQGYRPWDKEARITQEYWLHVKDAKNLFSMYPATDIEAPQAVGVIRWPEDHSLVLLKGTSGAFRYRVSTPTVRTAELREAIAAERADLSVGAPAVPENIPVSDRVKELADSIRRKVEHPDDGFEVARAIENYLKSDRFTYTLDTGGTDYRREPIEFFLFERRRGHCEYFAAAMAVLCQLDGIPARLVHGYHGGEYNEVGQFYLVRQDHAHSWVEVFLPTQDWVVFDPTPVDSFAGRAARSWQTMIYEYLDFLEFQWINLFVSYDGGRNAPPVDNPEDEGQGVALSHVLRTWREFRSWIALPLQLPWHQQIVVWTFATLAVVLSAFAGRVLLEIAAGLPSWCVRKLARHQRVRDHRAVFYDRIMDELERRGYRRPAAMTPREYADLLCLEQPDWQPIRSIVDAYYRIEYGRETIPQAQMDRIWAFLRLLQADPRRKAR